MRRQAIVLVALLLALSGVTALAPAAAVVFDDVAPTTYYADAALWAGTRGISNGTGPGEFSPDDPLTRADAMTLLWRAFGSPEPVVTATPPFFTDVPAGTYYRKAVEWAFYGGITTGKTATTFAPGDTITRAEFSTMLWRAYGSVADSPAANGDELWIEHTMLGQLVGTLEQPDGFLFEGEWTAVGGTGMFTNATGSGDLHGTGNVYGVVDPDVPMGLMQLNIEGQIAYDGSEGPIEGTVMGEHGPPDFTAPGCPEWAEWRYSSAGAGQMSHLGRVEYSLTQCTVSGAVSTSEGTITFVAAAFSDVPAGSYYEEAVNWMTANGITTGTTPTTFSPDVLLTRAMGVTFLWRAAGEPETFTLNMFHIDDHHSHLQADDIGLEIGGSEVEFELGGFPRVVSTIDALRASNAGENNMVIHAGDAITGTLFYTLFEGEADAALMNEACFDILVPGNHEFDGSDAGLVKFLDFLDSGLCDTEVITANVAPKLGTPLAPSSSTDYLEPNTIRNFGGEQVGFVGITIAQKTKVSSSPLETTQFLDELTTAQAQIDQLTAQGVDKIVLITHYGYSNDVALASALSGVDAIVGGDSHTLLGDFDKYGLTTRGDYPTQTTNADGDPVCIVHAWQYSTVVGALSVHFDEDGTVVDCTGSAHLLLGDVLENEGGVPDATIQAAIDSDPQLMQIAPDAAAGAVLDQFAAEVDVLAAEVIGTVSEDLCLARFPYDGSRSEICDDADLPNGGDIQQLVTEAFLTRAFRADIALQNSGGVRIDIPAGNITIAQAYELLPFANTLFELEMTGAEVALALEQGLSNVLDKGGSSGAYPYGAGIRWDVDTTATSGNRFSNIEVKPKGTDTWVPIDLTATYVVVANSFMGGGGDGYQVLADVVADGRSVDTFLDYAQSFIDYIVEDAGGVIGKPTEYSTQNYSPAP